MYECVFCCPIKVECLAAVVVGLNKLSVAEKVIAAKFPLLSGMPVSGSHEKYSLARSRIYPKMMMSMSLCFIIVDSLNKKQGAGILKCVRPLR